MAAVETCAALQYPPACSMVEQEFLGIKQRPEDVLVALPLALHRVERLAIRSAPNLVQMRFGEREFGRRGWAGKGGEIPFAELFFIAPRIGGEAGRGARIVRRACPGCPWRSAGAGLREAGFLGALAFAGARGFRPAEDGEEIGAGVEAVVRQRDGARARRQPAKLLGVRVT